MSEMKHYITMKGTNKGIVVYLDDQCSFEILLQELEDKVKTSESSGKTEITVHSQYRYLTDDQRKDIAQLIDQYSDMSIKKIDSYVLTREESYELYDNTTVKSVIKTIRSGQVHEVKGDALVIGDVNPGGTVLATGNIFVMGKLRGIAHAGFNGDESCVVAASYMHPSQIRIANKISRAPDYDVEGSPREFAYVNSETEQIELDQLQHLQKIRPNLLDVFERGL
ncbi:septum site-determining protein MinC [Tenuibacillus multivorans]|uniref:Probable septum site-determining protein MinC n=1 Tax=Tenuibacillus multivorans TaxID=237069 RepID=A0A1G9ZLK8_9BACI|nr:septum site-determining protein MinC [Tenuibacillus multivorans]GEL77455.1 putative septum site-determining protein MinC [Tenuibacillus multivorans]SDN21985.1 septum site-determining protein MinC [Tenuibacillus multivorans]